MMLGGGPVLHLRRHPRLADVGGVVLALALCALWGVVVERIAVRPFAVRGSNSWLMATVALGVVLGQRRALHLGKDPAACRRRR